LSSEDWDLLIAGWVTIIEEIGEGVSLILGLGVEELSLEQMAVRVPIVYITAVIVVRLGKKRFLGKNTAFDVIIGIMLGSILSRAITGNSPFFPTLAASFVLMGIHWLFAALAFRLDRFGPFIKGRPRTLVENGEILWDAMRKSYITQNDLLEAARSEAKITELDKIKTACLERSGDISVIPIDTEPEVIEVVASAGVQTIRIQLEHPVSSPREQQLAAHIAELERKVGQLTMENDALKNQGKLNGSGQTP